MVKEIRKRTGPSDLNLEERECVVFGKGDKERFVPLGKTTKEMICEYLEACPHESNYLLVASNGNQLTPNTVKLFITKLREKVEIPNLTSHKLRHNFATNYVLDMYREQGFVDLYKFCISSNVFIFFLLPFLSILFQSLIFYLRLLSYLINCLLLILD